MQRHRTIAIAFFLIGALHVVSANDQSNLAESLKGPWISLRLDFFHDGGDYCLLGPCLLIRRLPDNRIVLSYAEKHNGSDQALVPWGFMTEAEVSEVIAKTIQFWEKAKTEQEAIDREDAQQKRFMDEQIAKLPVEKREKLKGLGLMAPGERSTIKIRISTSDRHEDETVFDQKTEKLMGDWMTFLKEAAGRKR